MKSMYLPTPFFVEVLSRTGTTIRHLDFYSPHVVSCPIEVAQVIQVIMRNRRLSAYLDAVKIGLLSRVEESLTKADVYTIALDAIVVQELKGFFPDARTRGCFELFDAIRRKIKSVRQKRVLEEDHMPLGFVGDFLRTMNEFNYFVAKENKRRYVN